MADNSKIEWTDATWNPVTGCSVVSPGCTNCYAMRLAGTRLAHLPSRVGLTQDSKAGPVWTGEVRFNEEWLTQPLGWRKPRMIFVCAHGDLFHEAVPDDVIDRVFAVMALARQHRFQVLTKRSARMRTYMNDLLGSGRWLTWPDPRHGGDAFCAISANPERLFPHVWLGVSVEDQARADERIPDLLATPAAVRWVSAEPLLGPVDLTRISPSGDGYAINALRGYVHDFGIPHMDADGKLDWVVVGGESGPSARTWDGFTDAARSIRDQCQDAGVAFFMKQMQGVTKRAMAPIPGDLMIREYPDAR
jgi:protein gp37